MLNDTTKKKINSLRQILVGKVPDPKSQVEQITNALIYKYMDDMDRQAEAFGGKAAFFVGEYEKYSWRKLMDPKVAGQERMNLYVEALEKMATNKNLSPIFRDILKGAFLPYRSPETLNLFLQEIDGFAYEHSEELGNAYEYLLSIMGAQGDAGQFRTPRHIIDFIVRVVNPQKGDKVHDPACGTAGFLISAYKHILGNHDGKDNETGEKTTTEKSLTASERKELHKNFVGYDISPEMVKLSRVNMFLHSFPEPKITEYDTLSDESRWEEKFDVILANPPFMSPKGGIMPHKRFGITATRAEVLFTDYIVEHLTRRGRAGIIVPEGIIFQSGKAYKELRKHLVEDGLSAVVSLPSGVFNPYAGVKTSVLLFDAEMGRKKSEILFVKAANDGFDLGAQRRPIDRNDLPEAERILRAWRKGEKIESPLATWVSREKIAETGDYNLSGDRYRVATDYSNAKWPMVELGDVAEILKGSAITKKDTAVGNVPVIAGGQEPAYYHNESNRIGEVITVSASGAYAGFVNYFTVPIFASDCSTIQTKDETLASTRYIFSVLKAKQEDIYSFQQGGGQPHVYPKDLKTIKIPLPPLEIQEQIVVELDGYASIISGAKQIAKNWKPKIDIDPEWENVKLGDDKVLQIVDGDRGSNYPNKEEFKPEGFCLFLSTSNVRKGEFDFSKCDFVTQEKDNALRKGKLIREDVVLTTRGTLGNTVYFSSNIPYENIRINSGMVILRGNLGKIYPNFLLLFLNSLEFEAQVSNFMSGSAQPQLPIRVLNEIEIPLPPLETQKQIVEKIEAERALVESSKKLIEIYEQKTKDVIVKLWR